MIKNLQIKKRLKTRLKLSKGNSSGAIRIAIIDSGIDLNLIIKNKIFKAVQVDYIQNKLKVIDDGSNVHDNWGHGTECCKIIDSFSDKIEFLIVKIFDDKTNKSDTDKLSAAINFCISQNVAIINMSLGFVSEEIPMGLFKNCNRAYNKGIILVAAANNENKTSYPAGLTQVIGVGNSSLICDSNVPIDIRLPVPLSPSGNNYNVNSSATSFCCARITGEIAQILSEEKKTVSKKTVLKKLKERYEK